MAEYLIKDSTLIEITDAVREKTGKVSPIPVLNLANEIKSLQASNWKLPTLDGNYPEDVNVKMVGEDPIEATFNIAIAEQGEPAVYTYQWYMDGKAIEGETGITYTVTGIKETVSHKVYCEVTSATGVVNSRIATLNVQYHYLPELDSSYPANATVVIKNSVTCKVVVSANGNPMDYTYQWYVGDNAVSGATESSYQYTPSAKGTYKIYCVVTNSAGSVTSRTATITVNPLYLYNNGDQCTAVTGGWTVGSDATSSLYVKDTRNGEVIPYTNSKVPSSKYSKLCVEYKYTSKESSGSSSVRLRLVSKLGSSPTVYAYVSFDKSELNVVKTSSVDISSVTVDAYLKFSAYYAKSNVYRIWME